MRGVSALAQIGVFAFLLILLSEVMSHPMWGEPGTPPTTVDFAVSMFGFLTSCSEIKFAQT